MAEFEGTAEIGMHLSCGHLLRVSEGGLDRDLLADIFDLICWYRAGITGRQATRRALENSRSAVKPMGRIQKVTSFSERSFSVK